MTESNGDVTHLDTETAGDNGVYPLHIGITDAIQWEEMFPSSGAVAHLNYYLCPEPA